MMQLKHMMKKIVAVMATLVMTFLGMASYMKADAFYQNQGYGIYNYETQSVSKYVLRVNLPILDGNGGTTRAGLIDDRIPDTEVSVVRLQAGGNISSGFIVDNHIIATAAHCVYNYESKQYFPDMRVDIYDENCTTILKTVYPKEAHVALNFVNNKDFQYDYALLYVEKDLSEYGIFSLGVAMDDFMTSNSLVTISGFPGTFGTLKRYKGVGNIVPISSNLADHQIQYTAYASPGDSGGPVYTTQTFNGRTYHTVIGIHTTGTFHSDGSVGEHRFGTRVTSTLLVFYYNNEKIGSTVS